MSAGWDSVRLEELEPISVVSGTLLWRPIRRTLDVGAFGINAYVAPEAGDDVVEEHDESTLGHEELYLVLTGRAAFTLGGETLDAPAGTVVFIRDPSVVRHARAEEAGTQVLAVGGPRGGCTSPRPGRTSSPPRGTATPVTTTRTSPSSRRRSSDGPSIRRSSTTSPERRSSSVGLRKRSPTSAVELNPDLGPYAAGDDDFAALRERPDWQA